MRLTLVAASLCLAGCANPYAKFYQGNQDARSTQGYIVSAEPVKVYSTNSFEQDRRDLQRRSFVQVGHASFEAGTNVTREQLVEQAEKVGAHVVLAGASYARTDTNVVPIVTPNNSTSYTSGSATAYSSQGGSATAYGSSTTRTYGSTTNFVPVSNVRNNYGAAFFVKVKSKLGILPKALSDEQRRQFQSNTGVVVDVVVDGSPAFLADVFPGDILVSIDGVPMVSPESLSSALSNSYPGKPVKLALRRVNEQLEKNVTLAR